MSTLYARAGGGVARALLNATGRFVLQMMYPAGGRPSVTNPKLYHCAMYDADFACITDGVSYRGALKDNQADVKVHLADESDRSDTHADRARFDEPCKHDMRICRVYKLVADERKHTTTADIGGCCNKKRRVH